MHLLARDLHGLDDAGAAVDLEQTPGKIVFLSFSDSELGLLARVHDEDAASRPSLRCASLAQLKHPFSVDLYLDKVARHARLVVVRLLGGKEYWSYGVEQLAALSRAQGFALAIVPGDNLDDQRLREASTLAPRDCARIWSFFQDGGAENMRALLGLMASLIGMPAPWRESARIESAGYCDAARRTADADARRALLVFYRSLFLSDDHAPILALADALSARGVAVEAAFVASLKEQASEAFLREAIGAFKPDVIVNTTAFSARNASGGALDLADAPVLQAALATSTREAWAASKRGANGADLAMNIVLPEVDGRIFTRAISFKAPAGALLASQFAQTRHAPEPSRIAFVAELAANWAGLRRKANRKKSLALILSDYPARRGRGGYAIGLDTQASVEAIVEALIVADYDVGESEAAARSDARARGRSLFRAAVAGRLSPPVRRIASGIRERRPKRLGRARARLGQPRRRLSFFVFRVRENSSSRFSPIAARGPSGARPITTPTRRRVISTSPSICGCAIDAPSTR